MTAAAATRCAPRQPGRAWHVARAWRVAGRWTGRRWSGRVGALAAALAAARAAARAAVRAGGAGVRRTAEGDDEHVGDGVLEAERDERRDREPG